MNLNRAFISGTVKKTPELREKKNGTPATNLAIEVNEEIYNRSNDDYFHRTTLLDCCAFGHTAEDLCDEVQAGDHITITGPIQRNSRTINDVVVAQWQIQILDYDLGNIDDE